VQQDAGRVEEERLRGVLFEVRERRLRRAGAIRAAGERIEHETAR
jgi:hypothetical protein